MNTNINPAYPLAYELHELTPIKIIKCTWFYLDENLFRGILAILWIWFGFIRVIRGLMHYLGLSRSCGYFEWNRRIPGFIHHLGLRVSIRVHW